MPTSGDIRKQFMDFFVKRCGHKAVSSSSVVPHDDPTLLFTNAGMNQFKDVFLSVGTRPYTRAVNTQKCIRAGGKHNDLDDVGKDTYHHTFFEMLGNWSFGDYFKAEAIEWAWELLTEVWGVDKSRLHATVFEGDKSLGLERDTEAAELWLKATDLDPAQIHFFGAEDNFWEMGDTGPCGPCSEIHIDLTPDRSGADLVNRGDPRVIEIWNLVFIQFNRGLDSGLTPLPARHVDTGMGFERICAVLQGKASNYDTDIFRPIFQAIAEVTGARSYDGEQHTPVDVAYRVIADHIRALVFALSDGAHCGNEGRDYVLRRILRRAVRFGRQNLGVTEPFLYRLAPVVVEQMQETFPELGKDLPAVAEELRDEEESFRKTLDRGIELFEDAARRAEQGGDRTIAGTDAFELLATFGFPIDLTRLMAEERDMKLDEAGFEQRWQEHVKISRGGADADDARAALVEFIQQNPVEATRFLGHEQLVCDEAHVVHVLRRDNGTYAAADALAVGESAALVTETTPFYAEAGGQVGDQGRIHTREGATLNVLDTIRVGGVYLHLVAVEGGDVHRDRPALSRQSELVMEVDQPRRQRIMAHHTGTHLLNWALRDVLGDHVEQKGSLVDEERTRFDFANPRAVTAEQVEQIQELVNERIAEDLAVYTDLVPQEQALKINGLRAVFGEKYPPEVRVVSIGAPVKDLLKKPTRAEWLKYSIEFCGGTHLPATAAAGCFVITAEEAVAKGVRRVVAICGDAAERAREHARVLSDRLDVMTHEPAGSLEQDLAALVEAVDSSVLPLANRVGLREGIAGLQKILKGQRKAEAREAEGDVVASARRLAEAADGHLVIAEVEGADAKTLRTAMDVIRKKRPDAAMLLAARDQDRLAFVAMVPADLIAQGLKAGDWVKQVAGVTGGGGGGKPDMAQAGGKNQAKLAEALDLARTYASQKLGEAGTGGRDGG
ncbi:MAG: alanine--tRNA ligase [Phycisphaerae bacterium]|nr:alanine--tRNA ligase [Phycisphaerae bacterium]